MKRKTLTIIFIIVTLIIVGAALVLAGVIKLPQKKKEVDLNGPAVISVVKDGTYYSINEESLVLRASAACPTDVPFVSGVTLNSVTIGEEADPDNRRSYLYGMELAQELKKNTVNDVREINISESGEATVYVKEIQILFGKYSDVAKKAAELREFYDEVSGMKGTLYMQELADPARGGYSFLPYKETQTTQPTETNGENNDQTEENYEDPYEEEYEEEYEENYEENNEDYYEDDYYEGDGGDSGEDSYQGDVYNGGERGAYEA
ncbi:MAG: hypothetical protein HUJ75_05295 [Parasporobacterium sp.]|nr:hypothetical protein [Parasporobacterium sp.]